MPRPRFGKLKEDRQLHILETAAREFAAYGYREASFNRILELADISKGAAYYYFDDKADLFFATVQYYAGSWIGEITQIMPETLTSDTFWGVLLGVYYQPFTRFYDTPWAFGVLQALQSLPPDMLREERVQQFMSPLLNWLTLMIQQGQRLGLIRTDLADNLLFAVISGFDRISDEWMLRHWETLTRDDVDRVAQQLGQMMQRLISP